jgi:hypothetical protein
VPANKKAAVTQKAAAPAGSAAGQPDARQRASKKTVGAPPAGDASAPSRKVPAGEGGLSAGPETDSAPGGGGLRQRPSAEVPEAPGAGRLEVSDDPEDGYNGHQGPPLGITARRRGGTAGAARPRAGQRVRRGIRVKRDEEK